MQIGVIGLGRMGGNMSRRLMKAGHPCVVFDANAKPRRRWRRRAPRRRCRSQELVKAFAEKPRAVWVMLPAGRDHRKEVSARQPAGTGRHHH